MSDHETSLGEKLGFNSDITLDSMKYDAADVMDEVSRNIYIY